MKKIGIVTLQGNFNYGNRLQNFALEQAMISLGNNVQTLILNKARKKRTARQIISALIYHLSNKNRQFKKMVRVKTPFLMPFTEEYIHSQQFNLADIKEFDAFFVGSDQVWNPSYIGFDSRYFLSFAPKKKRFSYAASFGLSNIPKQFHEVYKTSLNQMNKISVREAKGIDIVKSISDASPVLVSDPTFLLRQERWNELADQSGFTIKDKYILVYMLSEISKTAYEDIYKYAKSANARVIIVMGDKYNSDYWIPNPLEFIAAIRGAVAVFTDSFHGTVFSIIFNTPFITFDRADTSMVSRIDTLISYFGLEENKFSSKSDIGYVLSKTKFDTVAKVLESEREKGFNFIQSCLKSVD